MSGFWRNWIRGWCLAIGVFGAVLVGGGLDVTSGPTRLILAIMNGGAEVEFSAPMHFSIAVLGAVTIGWSLTLMTVVQAANQLGERGRPIWVLLTGSVVGWYVIDSVFSIATGFALNAVSNTVFMAAFLLPVLRSGVLQDSSQTPRSA